MTRSRPSRRSHAPALGHDPVSVADAAARGWSRSAQRHSLAIGEVERVRRGVLADAFDGDPVAPERRMRELLNVRAARAATLTCSRALVSHASAAVAWGMPTLGDLARACVTVDSGTALRGLAGIHLHRAALPAEDARSVIGYPTTAPARTVLDVAREHGVHAGVVAADFALHTELADLAAIATAYEVCAGWPGRKAARLTLLLSDARAESPLESLSRLQMLSHSLPRPEPQVAICDEDGRFIGRVDFYWDEFGVVGEADGEMKYGAGPQVLAAERTRQRALEDAGLIVVRWGWPDVFAFAAAADRLRRGFTRGARAGSRDRRWGRAVRDAA